MVDSFHRGAAAEKAGQTRIGAIIRPGALWDAQWDSFGVNQPHGLWRTNEDTQVAVLVALAHEKGRELSDHVSQLTVARRKNSSVNFAGKAKRLTTKGGSAGRGWEHATVAIVQSLLLGSDNNAAACP